MFSVSEHYRSAINNSNPSYLTGLITFKDGSTRELSMADIAIGGPSITMQAVTQDVLEFGAAVLGQLEISIRTNKDESRYKYYDGVVTLDFNIETAGGVEVIPLGEYTITEAEKEKSALELVAYDNMFKLDKDYSLSLVGTPYDLMTTIAGDCGCALAEDEDYYKSLPNGDLTLTINAGSSCNTYRQAAFIVAQMCGAFVQADRYGKISLRQFSTEETFSLSMSERYKSTIADYVCTYLDLEVVGLAGAFVAESTENAVGMTMHMNDAPAWDSGTEEVLQRKADNLMAYLEKISYTPCELSMFSDPSIDCGDLIALETDNGVVKTLITSYTWKFHAPTEITSVGKNPYLLNNSANKQRIIRDIEVNGAGGTPAALYTFKNTRKFKCSDKLEPLAGVTFVATKDTFVMFDATFQIDVEVDDVEHKSVFTVFDTTTNTNKTYEVPYMRSGKAEVAIQYFYNNNAMIEPYILTLESGSHLVTLHYPINAVDKDSVNRFEVKMSANDGTVVVVKDKFLGTISGQGLAGKPKWDGTITVEEAMGAVYSTSHIKGINPMQADVTFSKPGQDRISGITAKFGNIISFSTFKVYGFSSEAGVNRVVTNYTMNTKKAHLYEFDRTLVLYKEAFSLATEFIYTSQEILTDNIDSGRMCSLTIKTDDKSNVEGVVIENV